MQKPGLCEILNLGAELKTLNNSLIHGDEKVSGNKKKANGLFNNEPILDYYFDCLW
jgi:hypothetical protein